MVEEDVEVSGEAVSEVSAAEIPLRETFAR